MKLEKGLREQGIKNVRNDNDGTQVNYEFDNGYGASVIKTPYSYGGKDGKYELAMILNGKVHYHDIVENDVLGWLTVKEVNEKLEEISKLSGPEEEEQ